VDTGSSPPSDCSSLALYVPAVDEAGNPACDSAALPICATGEGRTDLGDQLIWPDHCVDQFDQPGAVFNYPERGFACMRGATSYQGDYWCTMVAVDPENPAAGCYYKVGGTCSVTGRTMHPELRPPFMHQWPGFAICANGDVTMSNSATSTDNASLSAGHVAAGGMLTLSNSALIEGSVVVGGDISMRNLSHIMGDATFGGTLVTEQRSTVVGALSNQPWPSELCTCGYDLASVMAAAGAINHNHRLTDDPAIAPSFVGGALALSGSTTIILRGGDYFLTGLELRNRAVLAAAPGEHVRLYVAGPVYMENQTDLSFPRADGSRLDIVSDYLGEHRLVNNSDSAILFYAPSSTVILRNSAILYGGVTAGAVVMENPGLVVRELQPGMSGAVPAVCQWGEP